MAVSPDFDRPGHRFSVDEYHAMLEAGILTEDDRVELIEGEIVDLPPIGPVHASHVKKVAALFRSLDSDQAIVSVQDPVGLPPDSEPEPDVALLEPRDDFYRDGHPTAEDVLLIVEVADTTVETDRSRKVSLYGEHGIPAVWLVDLENRRLEMYEEPIDGEYTVIRKPPLDREIHVPGFEDVAFRAGDCFISD